jgi:hypothetical protein
MGLLSNVKRILKEDYQPEAHELVERLGFVLNNFMDQVTTQMNGNIDFSNLKEEIKTYKVTVNASGTPTTNDEVFTTVNAPRGVSVIRAENLDSPTTYVPAAVQVSYRAQVGSIKVLDIKGLTADVEYKLTLRISP